MDLVIHAAHTAMAAMTRRSGFFLFGHFSDESLSSQEQSSDGSCVLKRRASDFLGVHDTRFDQVLIDAGRDVIALVAFALLDFLNNDGTFHTRVIG